jgi:protein-histidine pros-kinase
MKLLFKFNLIFVLVMALGVAVSGWISRGMLQEQARQEVLGGARLLMEQATAVRAYTSGQITKLLAPQMQDEFLPQSVPSYSAVEVLKALQGKYPDFAYKEATLNPTNLSDRATDWEADIVNNFRNGSDGAKEIIGDRETPAGRNLYLARPLQIKDGRCLTCHSTADAAPKSMIDKYGSANGFGWNLNEVVGAQIVSVPMDVPVQRAWNTFKVFMGLLIALGAFIFLLLNVLLITLVVRPVNKLAGLADKVSLGDMNAEEFNTGGRDEIATLAESFSRMRKSLVHALKMLES